MPSPWIQTYTGSRVTPLAFAGSMIWPDDIGHSLAMTCRFRGHCAPYYSVAEHCYRVALLLPPPLQPWGLLYDAAEAYLGDVPTPIKRVSAFVLGRRTVRYRTAERRILLAIARHWDLPWPIQEEVHRADLTLLATEARDLMPAVRLGLPTPDPLPERIVPVSPERAECLWAEAYDRMVAPF